MKQEQIEYTFEEYIKPILKEVKHIQKLHIILTNYKAINAISVKDVKKMKFHDIVRMLVNLDGRK